MKLYFSLLSFIFLCSCSVSKDENNVVARIQVEQNLELVKSFVDGNPDPHLRIINAVHYLEKLTKIESESDGNDIGKSNPTVKDYVNWKKWYSKNKNKLYFDHTANVVRLTD